MSDDEERREQRIAALTEQVNELQAVVLRQREKVRNLKAELRQARKDARLPPILPAPPDAGAIRRVVAMAFGSLQHEVHTGRAFRRPHTSVLKTLYRAREALRQPAQAPAAKAPPQAAPPLYPPYQPMVAPRPAPLTIATILDPFSEACFRYEANLVPLSIASWREEMEAHRPAFLFCESAWVGNSGQWRLTMSKYAARPENPLRDLLAWCKERGVITVFWNKEDPAHFADFKDVAAEFDHVFTSDEDCIPRYRALLGHERIYPLPFAAQPAIHNPVQDGISRDGSVCFAGSWRVRRYPERATDSEVLLGPALDLGLDIFDRNATSGDPELAFPPPFASAVRGALDYPSMLTAYRAYKVFLNVNSVKASPTMFARRVFELMACGTPVVSSDSAGIRAMLGELVKIATTPDQTRAHLEQLLGDDGYRDRFAHLGYREVLEHHTYRERLERILSVVGLETAAASPPTITILAATNRPHQLEHLLANIRRQTHPEVEPIILLNADAFDTAAVEAAAADIPRVKVFQLPESYTLAECLNHGIDQASGAWVAKMDDDDHYGAHYLSDLLLATRYTDARVLGKRGTFCYLEASDQLILRFPHLVHRHGDLVHGATMFIRRDVFDEVRFSPVTCGDDTMFQRHCRERGIGIYSADPYNYIWVRQANLAHHTWRLADHEVLAGSHRVAAGLDLDLVMI
jgi:spore maturation protein CgeB